jgi:thioredoxin 1
MTTDTASNESTVSNEPRYVDGQASLNELIDEHEVVLADFYADWCGPCQALEPIVETVAKETEATVAKVDVDANQQLATAYGVRGVPTLVLFAGGEQVEKIVGLTGEDQLRSLIETHAK